MPMQRRFWLKSEMASDISNASLQLISWYPWLESGVAVADDILQKMNALYQKKGDIVKAISGADLTDETQQEIIAMMDVLCSNAVVPFCFNGKELCIASGEQVTSYNSKLLEEFGTSVNFVGLGSNNGSVALVLGGNSYKFYTGKSLPLDVLRIYKLDSERNIHNCVNVGLSGYAYRDLVRSDSRLIARGVFYSNSTDVQITLENLLSGTRFDMVLGKDHFMVVSSDPPKGIIVNLPPKKRS